MEPRDLTSRWTPSDDLLDALPFAVAELDVDGRVVAANPAFEQLTGYPAGQLVESEVPPFVTDEQSIPALTAARDGSIHEFETHWVDRRGEGFTTWVTCVPVAVDGAVSRILVIARDIARRIAAIQALEASERRFRSLFEGSGMGITMNDLQGGFIDANPTYCAMLGYSREELLQLDFETITHPDDRAESRRLVDELLAGEREDLVVDKRYVTKDGRTIWARVSVALVTDDDGAPAYAAVVADEITESKEAEAELLRSERLRAMAGRVARVGGWSLDVDTGVLDWSPEVFEIIDLPTGSPPTLAEIFDRYPPGDRERIEAAVDECTTEGTPFDLEIDVVTFSGRRLPIRAIGEAEVDPSGRIRRIHGAIQDLSDLHEAMTTAERAARQLSDTLESMADGFYTLDHDWRFTFVNPRAGAMLERSPAELVGQEIWTAFPEAAGSSIEEPFRRAMAGDGPLDVDEYHYRPLDLWVTATVYPTDHGIAVYFRDTTAQHRAAEALQERETLVRRQAALLDQAHDGILVRDLDHRITYWTKGAEAQYGWTSDEAVGASVRTLLYDDPTDFDEATAQVIEHGSFQGQLSHRTADGRTIQVLGRWSLLTDDDGRPEAILAINTDITERLQIEQQLLRSQRLESIGTLAGGIAHDLNNVLAPILLAADLLADDDLDDQERAAWVETIATSARRGADLVARVLTFARGTSDGERIAVDLVAQLDEIARVATETFPASIRVATEFPDELPAVLGDRTQIQQVLLNLVVNARDAMPDGGRLTIVADVPTLDDDELTSARGVDAGRFVRMRVADDGEGMAPEVVERLFEPFFTTKPPGSGTGLGLPTAEGIVRSHGGFIQVYSEPGRGSTFDVYLPVADQPVAEEPDHDDRPEPPEGSGRTVLFVDDEGAVRTIARRILEGHGYEVIEAEHGSEAVAHFAEHRQRIDVVVTDMTMPVMDGPATVAAIRAIDPDATVVGSSGLHGQWPESDEAHELDGFLPKPFTKATLLAVLAAVLAI